MAIDLHKYEQPQMPADEVREHLTALGLTQAEVARLLDLTDRTLRRYLEGPDAGAPGPVAQVLRAWLRLHRRGLPWRPDAQPLLDDDADAIAALRHQALELDAILERVRARGGPATRWDVDLARGRASFGDLQVSFLQLANGNFAPQSFRRTDAPVDLTRDQALLDDAFACIARALAAKTGPATVELAFMTPILDDGVLWLWDSGRARPPPIVAAISCADVRLRMNWPPEDASDEDCRRLVAVNLRRLAVVASRLLAHGEAESGPLGIRKLTLRASDLHDVKLRRVFLDDANEVFW